MVLAVSTFIFFILTGMALFCEQKNKHTKKASFWKVRTLFYILLMLTSFVTICIHYNTIIPLSNSHLLELQGQYFPLGKPILISGDSNIADYYAPSLLMLSEDEIKENPSIELSSYNDQDKTVLVTAQSMVRPLKHNDTLINVKKLLPNDTLKVGNLEITYKENKFVVMGKDYVFSRLENKQIVAISDLLYRSGLDEKGQLKLIFSEAKTDEEQLNPLEQIWLLKEDTTVGLINGAREAIKLNNLDIAADYKFSIKNNDEIFYGVGSRTFALKFKIDPIANVIYILRNKPLSYPLYNPPNPNISADSSSDPNADHSTKVFISSAPINTAVGYQLNLGEKNTDLVKGIISYELPHNATKGKETPSVSNKEEPNANKNQETPPVSNKEGNAQQKKIYENGFIINDGFSLRSYKFGETAMLGSKQAPGVLISINYIQPDFLNSIFYILLIWLLSCTFFISFSWISRYNYLCVLMPILHMFLAIRLILSYRGYLLPPNLSDSYEKALFACIFVPFVIFLFLYFPELFNSVWNTGSLTSNKRRFRHLAKEALKVLHLFPPLWYMLTSFCLMYLVGIPLSKGIPISLFSFLFAYFLLPIFFLFSKTLFNAQENPISFWLAKGIFNGKLPWVDVVILFLLPISLAATLLLLGQKKEEIFSFRTEIIYQPFLFLASCRFYMNLSVIFSRSSQPRTPIISYCSPFLLSFIYILLGLLVGDFGFLIYFIPILILGLIILWGANRFISGIFIAILVIFIGLILSTSIFTEKIASLLPNNTTVQYRYLAYQNSAWLQNIALDSQTSGSNSARRILRVDEHFWTMFHFASRGHRGVGYGVAPIEDVPFVDGIAQSDNVYSIYLLSEHGSFGGIATISLYLLLLLIAIFILTQHFSDNSIIKLAETLLIIGIFLTITFSAFYHAGGNTGAVPFTGKNMPLLSLNSYSDVVHIAILLALALSVIGRKDLPYSNSSLAKSFSGNTSQLNRLLLCLSIAFLMFFGALSYKTIKAVTDSNYSGDYNLEEFVRKTQEYISTGNISLDEKTFKIPPPKNIPGLAEGQYLKLLIDQFNSASPEEKMSGKYFFTLRKLSLDEDIYGSDSSEDRYQDTILSIDRHYFEKRSPFAKKFTWKGNLLSSDSETNEQGLLSGEAIGLFLIHKIDKETENAIPAKTEEYKVDLPVTTTSNSTKYHTSRRFNVNNENGEWLFDLYSIEADTVFEPHSSPTYVNGQEIKNKTRLESGDIIALGRSQRTGNRDLIFSFQKASSGTLANYIWRNGREVFNFPQAEAFALARPITEAINQNFKNLSQNGDITETNATASVKLSINASLNQKIYNDLAEEGNKLWKQINQKQGLPPRLAVTVMDTETGEVLALASWPSYNPNPQPVEEEKTNPTSYTNLIRNHDAKSKKLFYNHNLTRHVLGSATKPIIATAAACTAPLLSTLEVEDTQKNYNSVLGIPTKPSWKGEAMGNVDWDKFLIKSNNLYAVTIGFMGLAKNDETNILFSSIPIKQSFKINGKEYKIQPNFNDMASTNSSKVLNLETSPLAIQLNNIFDIKVSGPDVIPITSVWKEAQKNKLLPEIGSGINFISPELPNLSLNNVRDARQFVMVCLGGRTNLWSNVKSAEAFARLVTAQRVNASFVKLEQKPLFEALGEPFTKVQPTLLKALEGVALKEGTASVLENKIKSINQQRIPDPDQRFSIFSKTGTLENQYESNRNDSNYIFSAGIWSDKNQKLSKGVSVSVFIEKGNVKGGSGKAAEFSNKLIDRLNEYMKWTK